MRVLLIDYSSTFNTIVSIKLVLKLRSLGLNSSLCNWILNFLKGRPQVVRMDSLTSSVLTLSTGAPQLQSSGLMHARLRAQSTPVHPVATHSSNTILKFMDNTTILGLFTKND